MDKTKIIQRAISTYGRDAQIFVAIEEMAELTKALSKEKRKRYKNGRTRPDDRKDIAEEIADVQIMLDQLRIIFSVDTKITEGLKLKRLEMRLDEREGGKLLRCAPSQRVPSNEKSCVDINRGKGVRS